MSEPFKLGDVVAYDLERNDLAVLKDRRNDRMEPEQAAVFRFFANVPFPNATGLDGIPKTLPEPGVMEAGMENGHVPADELVFGISGDFEKPSVNGENDSGRVGFYRSLVASEEIDDGKEPRLFFLDGFDVLLEENVFERERKDSAFRQKAGDGVANALYDFFGVRTVAISAFERRKHRRERVGYFLQFVQSGLLVYVSRSFRTVSAHLAILIG